MRTSYFSTIENRFITEADYKKEMGITNDKIKGFEQRYDMNTVVSEPIYIPENITKANIKM